MVLVDTSVWVKHLRTGDNTLSQLLKHGQVFMHPMVMGELACGNLQNRSQLLNLWGNLPTSLEASHDEVLTMLEKHSLMGKGIGFVDAHLLAATLLTPHLRLLTYDKRLANLASLLRKA